MYGICGFCPQKTCGSFTYDFLQLFQKCESVALTHFAMRTTHSSTPTESNAERFLRIKDIEHAPYLYCKRIATLLQSNLAIIQVRRNLSGIFLCFFKELLEIPTLIEQQNHAVQYLRKTLAQLTQALEISEMQNKMRAELHKKVSISEQISIINSKLGLSGLENSKVHPQGPPVSSSLNNLLKKLETLPLPQIVRKTVDDEVVR